ncbi:putative TBC domain protein [Talaromyces proteolyticus]|uniref:TBC domain protein n=1 Tax=Talaromyces proteolyticus TaxID=1131652 RepID=A0AAD4KLC2_9EURO|nr:putative TBC domain protein [Talaromyces proteolyticus]KAH8692892.1 putative TBC domain protein [Talaromyces proteolyticus]
MKTVEEARRRWEILSSHGKSTNDLRQAVKAEEKGSPCDDGLRSVYWKAFLLYDNLEQPEWTQRLSDTRSAYDSLKDHFLKYIKHPDDLESTVDPLAEDDESPWQALRRDEGIRAEIYQDIERCLQENYFFREPSTKSIMLDILFIYSKLNPDLGYRQGMHELLAPVLWVVERDAVKLELPVTTHIDGDDDSMLHMLDAKYIEHDSFSIFCSIMQTARSFYEHTEEKMVNGHAEITPIVRLCEHIHNELLMIADNELGSHLNSIEILPQIFLTRWIRLLFGREFSFEDTLVMWDVIFADGLRVTLIDQICVAMLLRIRWQLLESDYSSALTLLLRYPPLQDHGAESLVHDALFLEQNSNPARGAYLISKYSGRPPEAAKQPLHHRLKGSSANKRDRLQSDSRNGSEESSPGRSPGRNNQRSLETLFQDVSDGLQRRTENWGVAKAVRGAVTEARRNMVNIEPGNVPSLRPWYSSPRFGTPSLGPLRETDSANPITRTILPEKEDVDLAQLLKDSLDELSIVKEAVTTLEPRVADALRNAYEKIRTAQLKARALQTHAIAAPTKEADIVSEKTDAAQDDHEQKKENKSSLPKPYPKEAQSRTPTVEVPGLTKDSGIVATSSPPRKVAPRPLRPAASASAARPPLADSEFSWMLGDNTHRSHFVSSASLPPDQRRHSESQSRQSPLFGEKRDQSQAGTAGEEDGLPLSSFT